MHRLLMAALVLLTTWTAQAQQPEPRSPGGRGSSPSAPGSSASARTARGPKASPGDYRKSLVLLQSKVGDQTVDGTAFIVETGPPSLAVTSYEAVRGASRIRALVPERGLVDGRLLRFAPDANLALLELSGVKLPPLPLAAPAQVKIGEAAQMITAGALKDGGTATAMTPVVRRGEIAELLARPGGGLLQLKFSVEINDDSSGAPVLSGATGEVLAVALSREAAPSRDTRLAVPAHLAVALTPGLGRSTAESESVQVVDGSQATVTQASGQEGSDLWLYASAVLVGGVLLLGLVVLRRREQAPPRQPFSQIPALPDGVDFAFIDTRGNVLPSDRDPIRIGRADQNDWRIHHPSVSNYHARLRKVSPGVYDVEDLRSSHGTFVKGRRLVESERVKPGMVVTFGKVQIMLIRRGQGS